MLNTLVKGFHVIEFVTQYKGQHTKKNLRDMCRKHRYHEQSFTCAVLDFLFDRWKFCDVKHPDFPLDPDVDGWTKLKEQFKRDRTDRRRKDRDARPKPAVRMSRIAMAAIPGVSLATIMTEQGCVCPCCKVDLILIADVDLDHILPLKLGGCNEYWNLQFLCSRCNRKKSAKEPVQWAAETGASLPDKFLAMYT